MDYISTSTTMLVFMYSHNQPLLLLPMAIALISTQTLACLVWEITNYARTILYTNMNPAPFPPGKLVSATRIAQKIPGTIFAENLLVMQSHGKNLVFASREQIAWWKTKLKEEYTRLRVLISDFMDSVPKLKAKDFQLFMCSDFFTRIARSCFRSEI